jgi:hypothetical protein
MKKSLLALSALGVALISAPAMAASVTIDDTSDNIVVSLNDFEFGFKINGNTVQSGLHNPASVTLDEADPANSPFTFDGSWIDRGMTTSVSDTVYFVEHSNPTVVSDILTYAYSTAGGRGHLTGSFQSDAGTGLGLVPPGATVVQENGSPVDFSNAFIGATATSDVDAVPLPAVSWGGFILLGAVGAFRLTRRPRPQSA